MSTIQQVAPTDLPDGALLLDVREPDEWAAGHAPQAVHIPMADLPERVRELPTDTVIACVCLVGGRSARAASLLEQLGYQAVNVAGGMRAWDDAGLPLVSDVGDPYIA